ncbi:MAG: hypothetical protein K9K65_11770 [Desulfarculaceae bacterium]|nr:hypothetical protein [Desulfarculaceae bacterium]MCF8122314.1 hypothetical protein [Desulfarculaceae bacterium]
MNNCRFLYNRLFDDAILSTVPGDNEQSGWPVENLQNTIHAEAWKTNGTGNVTLRADLGQAQAINAIGLAYFNLLPTTVVTFRAYSDAFTTETYSEELQVVGPIVGWLEGNWLEGGWMGYPDESDPLLYPRVTSLLPLAQQVGARYIALEFANGDDEFYLGRVFVGNIFEPSRNVVYGFKLEIIDSSEEDESLGGVVFSDENEMYRQFTLPFKYITRAEAIGGGFWNFAHYVGKRKDFVVQLMDSDTKSQRLTTIVGKFSSNPVTTGRAFDRYETSFCIREMV